MAKSKEQPDTLPLGRHDDVEYNAMMQGDDGIERAVQVFSSPNEVVAKRHVEVTYGKTLHGLTRAKKPQPRMTLAAIHERGDTVLPPEMPLRVLPEEPQDTGTAANSVKGEGA